MPDNSRVKTDQQTRIKQLEALGPKLTAPGRIVRVEAWALPQEATEPCSQDSDDGMGYCYGPTDDPLCMACQSDWIINNSAGGLSVSIDVAR
jgi:hypothetical protein